MINLCRRTRRWYLPYAAILLVTCVFFGKLFFPKVQLLYTPDFGRSDIWNFNYPLKDLLSRSLKNGELPFWSEDIGTGFPVFAEGQVGALNLLNLLLFYLFSTYWAFNLSYIFIFSFTATGSFLFFKKVGISEKSSLFSALAFSFGGYFIARMVHINSLLTASFMPWLFLATEAFWQKPTKLRGLLFAFLLAQQIFAGHLQWVFMSLLGLFVFNLVQMREKSTDELLKKLFIWGLAVVFGIVLALPQILPTYELLGRSSRKFGIPEAEIFKYPYPVKHLITFILPDYFGSAKDGTYPNPFTSNSGIYWENAAYLGILPVIFFLFELFKKKKSRKEIGFLVMAVISLVLVLGKATPFSLILTMPVFNGFRDPSRFLILTTFSLVALAGFGLDYFFDRLVAFSTRLKIGILIKKKNIIYGSLLGILILDLLKFGYNYHPLVSVEEALRPPETMQYIEKGKRIYTLKEQVADWNHIFLNQGWKDVKPYLYLKNGLDRNLNLLFGVKSVDVYAFLPFRPFLHSQLLPILVNAADAQYVITGTPLKGDVLELVGQVKAPSQNLPDYYVYKNPESLGRFRIVTKYKVGRTVQEIVAITKRDDFSFSDTAILEWEIEDKFEEELELGKAEIVEDLGNKLTLSTETDNKAILIVADAFDENWRAEVNGEIVEIFPVNINQRGIVIPAGKNQVVMEYQLKSFRQGIRLSVISVFFLILIFGFWKYLPHKLIPRWPKTNGFWRRRIGQ